MDIDWVKELQTYIRINTSQPNVNYDNAISYLTDLVDRMGSGLAYQVFMTGNVPLLVVTKPGNTRRGILLNSHMDVVSATNEKDWKFPPFSAHYEITTDRIYGRGTQDMKSQGIQYLAALYKLRNVRLDFDIHVSFSPNEEIGGLNGLKEFIKTVQFSNLNIQFAIDESCASPFDSYYVFYTERTIWQLGFRIKAPAGHAAFPMVMTCETKLRKLLNEIAIFRQNDIQSNVAGLNYFRLGYLTTINMTHISGGELYNVLPNEIVAHFDMRIGSKVNLEYMSEEIEQWISVANDNKEPTTKEGITIEWIKKSPKSMETNLDSKLSRKFLDFMNVNKVPYTLTIAPGSTDGRFLREMGIDVFGFTPIRNTPVLLHSDNEFIFKKQFLENIVLMSDIIKSVALD